VESFLDAINLSAQTALRESIGQLAQMITEHETLGRELQRILDEKTNPRGITVQIGQAETEISDKFGQAAAAYTENPNRPASSCHERAVRSRVRW